MEYGIDSKLMWLEIMRLASAQCDDYEYCCQGSRLWYLKSVAEELWLMLENGPPEGRVGLPYMSHSDYCALAEKAEQDSHNARLRISPGHEQAESMENPGARGISECPFPGNSTNYEDEDDG